MVIGYSFSLLCLAAYGSGNGGRNSPISGNGNAGNNHRVAAIQMLEVILLHLKLLKRVKSWLQHRKLRIELRLCTTNIFKQLNPAQPHP